MVFMKKFTVLLFSQDSLSVLWAVSSMSTGEQWQRSRPGSKLFRLWAWTKVKTSIMASECNYWNPCLYNLDQKCMKVLKNWILIWANKSILLRGFMVTVKKLPICQSISLSCRNMWCVVVIQGTSRSIFLCLPTFPSIWCKHNSTSVVTSIFEASHSIQPGGSHSSFNL